MAHSHYHRLRKPGTLEQLRVKVWRAVTAAEDALDKAMQTPEDTDRVARALHAAVGVYREYRTLLVDTDIEERLKGIEQQLESNLRAMALRN